MTPGEMTPNEQARDPRQQEQRISRLSCRGMRSARCDAVTGSVSKRRCATIPN